MRIAEALTLQADVALDRAGRDRELIDAALEAATEAAASNDECCLHDVAQSIRWDTAELLNRHGRADEARTWQEQADRYGDWEPFSSTQIPGHVHLWDTRIDASGLGRSAN